jgi:hypothetical protein
METLFDLMNGPHLSEEERRAIKGSEKAVQAVKDRLTLEEFDALWRATTDIDNAGYLDSFALGFRLGVQLTIEGLRPIVE